MCCDDKLYVWPAFLCFFFHFIICNRIRMTFSHAALEDQLNSKQNEFVYFVSISIILHILNKTDLRFIWHLIKTYSWQLVVWVPFFCFIYSFLAQPNITNGNYSVFIIYNLLYTYSIENGNRHRNLSLNWVSKEWKKHFFLALKRRKPLRHQICCITVHPDSSSSEIKVIVEE